MSKKPSITNITSGYASASVLNDNFAAIMNAFDNTVSLDGSTPNAMQADFDLNSFDLLNGRYIYGDRLYLNGTRVTSLSSTPSWDGAWTTSTAYVVDQLVRNDGSTYICVGDHTSGTFSTDLSAGKWELVASKGAAGAGTGDLLAANNLSDLADADTALSNLGAGTVGIAILKDTTAADVRTEISAQEQDDYLDDIVALTCTAGDILYFDGTDLVNLGIGTAGQVLTTNSGATAPEWADVSDAGLGVSQTWQAVTRVEDTSYQNSTGRPIQVSIYAKNSTSNVAFSFQVSTDNSTWVDVHQGTTNSADAASVSISAVIPDTHYYRLQTTVGTFSILNWSELR